MNTLAGIGLPRRFKKTVYSIDSSTITLVANYGLGQHRWRSGGQAALVPEPATPSMAAIEEGSHHDSRMIALCARLAAGEIAVFDKAYVHFKHLFSLTVAFSGSLAPRTTCAIMSARNAKSRATSCAMTRSPQTNSSKAITRSACGGSSHGSRWTAKKSRWFSLPTIWNGLPPASADSIKAAGPRYSSRDQADPAGLRLLGHSKQAICWQLKSALLNRCAQAWRSQWPQLRTRVHHDPGRGLGQVRPEWILWFYGTAGGKWRMRVQPQTAYLPGDWSAYGTA